MKPYYQDEAVTIYCGDCRDVLGDLACIDAVVSDPPYGIGMNGFRDELQVSVEAMNMSPGRKAITFMSPRAVGRFIAGCESWQFRRLLWWNKVADLSFPWRGWYMNSEAICVFDRGGAEWPRRCRFHSDLYQSGPEEKKPLHPAWKPLGVLQDLISHVAVGVVLDPFAGSGSTLRAAKDLGRKAIGIEIEERYCEIAAKRMSQEVFNFEFTEDPCKPAS